MRGANVNLNARDIDPFDLEELIYAVAAECRSEIGFAYSQLA